MANRLAHLVPHWIEHNDSHAKQFAEWAQKARGAGLGASADCIEAAARSLREAKEHLGNARRSLPKRERYGRSERGA